MINGKRNGSGGKIFDGKNKKSVLAKLREAFAIGASDEEASLYAEISVDALHRYQKNNPAFRKEKIMLKEKPTLKARQTVVRNLDDKELAFKYLTKKRRDEFKIPRINSLTKN